MLHCIAVSVSWRSCCQETSYFRYAVLYCSYLFTLAFTVSEYDAGWRGSRRRDLTVVEQGVYVELHGYPYRQCMARASYRGKTDVLRLPLVLSLSATSVIPKGPYLHPNVAGKKVDSDSFHLIAQQGHRMVYIAFEAGASTRIPPDEASAPPSHW
jgi:hypothetical protein